MIVEFKDVKYQIPNGRVLYDGLNLRIFKGDYYGILGKNGAGKSTLIEMIMGMRMVEKGQISVFGEDSNATNRMQKHKVFVVTHDSEIPSNIRVKDLHQFYKFFYPNYTEELQDELLTLFEIDPKQKFGSLSTGQKIKALLCCAFAAKTELYIFDEVTAVLDPKSRRNFFKFLNRFRDEHECCLLMATNIAEDLYQSVDKVLFINEDKVIVENVANLDALFDIDEEVA